MRAVSKLAYRRRVLWQAMCSMIALAGTAGVVHAGDIDTGVPGFDLRWDNTIRYNIGERVQGREAAIYNNPNFDESDAKFAKGSLVTNRIDLLSELDGKYQTDFGRIGFRVSAAGWDDFAYDNNVKFNPAVTAPSGTTVGDGRYTSSYTNDKYSSYTSRYYTHSGELLDAFAFINTTLGDVPVTLKVGRHSLYWGESLFFGDQSISYSQQPIDGLKAATSPGIETKEVFLPQSQISLSVQPTSDLVFAAQYSLEWDPSRVPEGGTYFGNSDFLNLGPNLFPVVPIGTAANFNLLGQLFPLCPTANPVTCPIGKVAGTPPFVDSAVRIPANEPGNNGNYGVNARWSPDWAKGTIGIYYRHFDERTPWAGILLGNPAIGIVPTALSGQASPIIAIPTTYKIVYPTGAELYGLSYTRNIGATSVAAELSYREHTALNNALPSSLTGSSFSADEQGPKGNIVNGVVNMVTLLPHTPFFDTGTFIAELAWSHLTSVTDHPELYSGVGYAGCNPTGLPGGAPGDRRDGCSTRNFVGAQVNVEPQWLQAFPGVDLSAPISYFVGLHGNKQDNGDGFQGEERYSLGVSADVRQKYKFTLSYNGSYAQRGAAQPWTTRDRGWISLTFKTTL